MIRDLDLLRSILIKTEASDGSQRLILSAFTTESHNEKAVSGHIKLLLDAGYIEASRRSSINQPYDFYWVERITMAGHDYLEAVRNDTVWNKTKIKLRETGLSVTLEMVKSVAVATLKETLGI